MNKSEFIKLRETVILAGKSSKEFLKVAFERDPKKKNPKYWNKNNIDESGATGIEDAEILYKCLDRVKPKIICEIGTWFGTSAYMMLEAAKQIGFETEIYTCDEHKVFVKMDKYVDKIHYRNKFSTEMLEELKEKNIKIDFSFIDASLRKNDVDLLLSLFRDKPFIVLHDYETKGGKNINRLMRHYDFNLIKPPVFGIESTIAILEPK